MQETKGDITFMCRPAMLQMMKHGNEAIGSKVNFALENCLIGIEAASRLMQIDRWLSMQMQTSSFQSITISHKRCNANNGVV